MRVTPGFPLPGALRAFIRNAFDARGFAGVITGGRVDRPERPERRGLLGLLLWVADWVAIRYRLPNHPGAGA